MLNVVAPKSPPKSSRDGKAKKQLKETAYLRMMRDPLSVKRWTILWEKEEDVAKGKKTIARSFKTKLPVRKIITLHFNGTITCPISKSAKPSKKSNKGIEYKIWINEENKIAWGESKSIECLGVYHIDKSISLIIPKKGNTNLSILIEDCFTTRATRNPIRIDKGFTIRVTKISSF